MPLQTDRPGLGGYEPWYHAYVQGVAAAGAGRRRPPNADPLGGPLEQMPIQSTVEPSNKTIVSRATGHITLQDLTDYFASVWVGPQNAGFSEIFDWTDIDHIDLSLAELRSFAGPANAFYDDSSPSKLAIIAPGRRGTRMAQLYRNFREMRGGKDPEIQVFSDMASARAWLGIP